MSQRQRGSSFSSSSNNATTLVRTWLTGIGLSDSDGILANLEAAGIITPSALSELEVSHFEMLGIQNPDDRRKLFFLIQRIRMEQQKQHHHPSKNPNPSTNGLIDAVMAKTTTTTTTNPTTPRRTRTTRINTNNNNDEYHHHHTHHTHTQHPLSPESFVSAKQHQEEEEEETDSDPFDHTDNDDDDIIIINNNNQEEDHQRLPTTTTTTTTTIPKRMTRSMARRMSESAAKTTKETTTTRAYSSSVTNTNKTTKNHTLPTPLQADIAGGSTDDKTTSCKILYKSDSDLLLEQALNPDNNNQYTKNNKQNNNNGSTHSSAEYSVILDEVLKDEDQTEASYNTTTTNNNNTSKTTTTNHRPKATMTTTTAAAATTSKLPAPRYPNRRTGKPLSTIPAESVPPMSPLIEINLQSISSSTKTKTSSSNPQHRRSGSATQRRRNSTSFLEQPQRRRNPLQSSNNTDDDDDDAQSVSSSNSHRSTTSSTSQRHRRRSLMLPPTTTSSTILHGTNAATTPTRKNNQRATHTFNRSSSSTSTAVSVTSNENIANNWNAQIERLREINAEEHEALYGISGIDHHDDVGDDDDDDIEDDEDNNDDKNNMRIRVVVRKRPMNSDAAGDIDIVHAIPCRSSSFGKILVYQPKTRVDLTKTVDTLAFAFDDVYDASAENVHIYHRSVRNLIPGLFQGQWGSIFAYGQTGSGKTFTMMGDRNCTSNGEKTMSNIRNFGLYYMAALDIFHAIQHTPNLDDLYVSISLFEIYGGKLFDLLNSRASVKCLEDSCGQVNFPGLSQHRVESPDALLQLIEVGNAQRSTGTTSRNADSSRSHAVLQIHIYRQQQQQRRRHQQNRSSASSSRRDEEFSRLTFIDLAGSERGVDTASSSRATRLEGAEINTSLLALKEVIRALAVGGSGDNALAHVPFRGSKLTQVLKQSFVGKNCRSVMVACISPNIGNCEQTLNTLRYADRVKERNAATGEVRRGQPGKVEQQPLPPVKSVLPPTTSSKNAQSMNLLKAVEFSRASSSNHSASNTSEVLDDLLASPESASDIDEFTHDGLDHQQIIDDLIETHKDVVSVMLDMVQEEMMLVNAADANRQSDGGAVFDDLYMAQVQTIQEEQLAMITLLREQLSQYRMSMGNPNRRSRAENDLQDLLGVALNDSYVEDLRFD